MPASTPGSAVGRGPPPFREWTTSGRPEIQALLDENSREMDALRTTSICKPAPTVLELQSAEEAMAGSKAVANPSSADMESHALKAEIAQLKADLQEAHARAQKVGECERRKGEIHNVLLRSAHDEAVAAARQARQEVDALRAKFDQQAKEFAAFRARADVQQRTAEADHALLATEVSSLRAELLGARADGSTTSVAGVHLAALRSSLEQQDEMLTAALSALASKAIFHHTSPRPASYSCSCATTSSASASSLQQQSGVGGGGASLEQIQQWSSGQPTAAASSDPGDAAKLAKALERLVRLEQMAETATGRFEELQKEHAALRSRYSKLQRNKGAETGSAAVATAMAKRIMEGS